MLNALVYMALMRVDLLVLGLIADEVEVGLYRVAVEGGVARCVCLWRRHDRARARICQAVRGG
jgi:hypothetical protein